MTAASMVFLDTNILLAACDESRTKSADCRSLLESGLSGEQSLFTNGQVLREYLVVATRPIDANGLGMTPKFALANLAEFKRCTRVLDETADTSAQLEGLIERHKLKGKRIHDANLIATMLTHGIKRIATLNPGDFRIFKMVEINKL